MLLGPGFHPPQSPPQPVTPISGTQAILRVKNQLVEYPHVDIVE